MIWYKAIIYHPRDYFSVLWSKFENKQFFNTSILFSPCNIYDVPSFSLIPQMHAVFSLLAPFSAIMHWGSSDNLKRRQELISFAKGEQYYRGHMGKGVGINTLSSQMDALNRQFNQQMRCPLNLPLTFHPHWNCCSEFSYLAPLVTSELHSALCLSKKHLGFIGYPSGFCFPFCIYCAHYN